MPADAPKIPAPATPAPSAAPAGQTPPSGPAGGAFLEVDGVAIPDADTAKRFIKDGLSVQAAREELAAREARLRGDEQRAALIDGMADLARRHPEIAEHLREVVEKETIPAAPRTPNASATDGEDPPAAPPQDRQLQGELARVSRQVANLQRAQNASALRGEVAAALDEWPLLRGNENAKARELAERLVLANKVSNPGASARQLAAAAATDIQVLLSSRRTEELQARRTNAANATVPPGDGSPGLANPPQQIANTREALRTGGLKASLKQLAASVGIRSASQVLQRPE